MYTEHKNIHKQKYYFIIIIIITCRISTTKKEVNKFLPDMIHSTLTAICVQWDSYFTIHWDGLTVDKTDRLE